MTEITIGLIGIGDMASVHADAAHRLGLSLAVAAGQNRDRARTLAERTGARLYDSVDDLLAAPGVDAVDLCVPNDLHRHFAERAFAAGKHVLCEKPIALNLEDADAMISGAQTAGVILMVGHVVRFWPEYERFHRGVKANEFGKVDWLSLSRLTGVLSATAGRENWRANVRRSGGAVLDLQIHDLDFLYWTLGAPRSIYSRGIQSPGGTWDHVLTTATFDTCSAAVEASFLMQGAPFELGFHAIAEKGAVVYRYSPASFALHGLHGEDDAGSTAPEPSLRLYPAGAEPRNLYVPERDSFELAIERELQEFADAVSEGRDPLTPGHEARASLAISLASLESCTTGQVIHTEP